ncbi:cupin domain-containing protein [Pontiella sp.]|uniref:cupin domain-containing protein n=1 Tax=Pontiella sp. TaxID=2837462 RepID=UPI0035661911
MKLIKISDVPETPVSHNAKIRKQVIVGKGIIPGITNVSRAVFPPGEVAGSHLHNDMTEVFTCESGCGEIRINDVGYVFSPGTTVVVEPGDVHEIINSGTADLVVSWFAVAAD